MKVVAVDFFRAMCLRAGNAGRRLTADERRALMTPLGAPQPEPYVASTSSIAVAHGVGGAAVGHVDQPIEGDRFWPGQRVLDTYTGARGTVLELHRGPSAVIAFLVVSFDGRRRVITPPRLEPLAADPRRPIRLFDEVSATPSRCHDAASEGLPSDVSAVATAEAEAPSGGEGGLTA